MNNYFGFKEVKLFNAFILFVLVSIIIPSLIVDFNLTYSDNYNFLSLCSNITMFIFLLFMFRTSKDKVNELFKDFLRKVKFAEVLNVVITQVSISLGSVLLLVGILYFINPDNLNFMLNSGSDNVTTFSKFILYFLLVAISAPLVEELLFRAIFFKRMSRYFSTVISMIFSSLIFGFLHIELAVIGAIMFATSNCILYIKYKNILIPILTHFTNNLISILPQMNFSSNSPILMTKDIAISALSIGFILFLFGMFLFIKFVLLNKNYLKYNF